jgi:hypothetical protein
MAWTVMTVSWSWLAIPGRVAACLPVAVARPSLCLGVACSCPLALRWAFASAQEPQVESSPIYTRIIRGTRVCFFFASMANASLRVC